MPDREEEYQVESAMDTLLKAEDIKQNKKLLGKAINIMKKKQKNMTAILREAAIKAASKK